MRRFETWRRHVVLAAIVVLAIHAGTGTPATCAATRGAGLAVEVVEQPGIVRLRILLPPDVPPASIEVQLGDRSIVVQGRDLSGRQLRSRRLKLSQPVVEAGATADYEPDGSLTIRLHGPDGLREDVHER